MAFIRSSKHVSAAHLRQTLLAVAALSLPMAVSAQQAPVPKEEQGKKETAKKDQNSLPEISVQSAAYVPYKTDAVSSPKFVKPLLDTPQTVSVIKKELLQEQAAFNVMDALRNTPGITMQLGENGNTAAGDTFQMRGFASQSSMFVDGVRDLGAVTRDTFNIEQLEVVKGPAGADVGRGAASGFINLVSKQAELDNFSNVSASLNNGRNKRLSADLNRKVGEDTALRLNVFKQAGGVLGRDQLESNASGFAPAFAVGLGGKARAYFYSQHIRQNNVPDGGVPTVGLLGFYSATPALMAAPKVRPENYYGSVRDYEKVQADMASAKFEFDLGGTSVLRNITRYGKSSMQRVLTGVNALNANGARENWTVVRTRQGLDQDNEIFANQSNFSTSFATGTVQHAISAGVELLMEEQQSRNLAVPTGSVITPADLYLPDAQVNLVMPVKNGAYTDGQTTTTALYLFDAIDLTPQWQINGGARMERYRTQTKAAVLSTLRSHPKLPVGTMVYSDLAKSDNLSSWKLGAVFKPAKNGSLYVSFASSKTPPGSANFGLSAAADNLNNSAAKPQTTMNTELGTKWDLMNKTLNFTAALYRTENSDEIVQVDAVTNTFAQFGKRRVEGIELGVVGQFTPDWQVTAGLATMKTKVLQGSTGNNAAGATARWSPDLSATLWSTYKLAKVWTIGGGWRYVSEQKRVIDPGANLALQNLPSIPSSWLANAFASYQVSNNIALQLNINNLTDKFTINSLNNSGARYTAGAPRSITLSGNILF